MWSWNGPSMYGRGSTAHVQDYKRGWSPSPSYRLQGEESRKPLGHPFIHSALQVCHLGDIDRVWPN